MQTGQIVSTGFTKVQIHYQFQPVSPDSFFAQGMGLIVGPGTELGLAYIILFESFHITIVTTT